MIDLNTEFKRMSMEFGISDKEVLLSVRTILRSAWGDSVFKQKFLNEKSVLVENTNPRSKGRYPQVRRYTCAICGEMFGSSDIELDHLVDENSLKSFDDINSFMVNIVLTSPDKLQILCKDKKKRVKGKSVISSLGCHGIKTYSSRYDVSFEQARIEKQFIQIKKEKKVVDKLLSLGVESMPKLKKDQESLLRQLLLEGVSDE